MNARRVDKNNLRSLGGANAGNAVARRLRPGRNDRDFLPEDFVQQSRFADIGPPDYGDITGAKSPGAFLLALFFFLCHKCQSKRGCIMTLSTGHSRLLC